MDTIKFTVSNKEAELYPAASEDRPLAVFNNYSENGDAVMRALRDIRCPDINFLCVRVIDWDRDMSPWYCPPLTKDDVPFTGGADEYLDLMLTELLPKARGFIKGTPSRVCIAGYSLAGLFALYALYKCDVFDRAASMSGSLWFPNFREFVLETPLKRVPDRIYLSLGDREARSRHTLLKTVQDNTELIAEHYKAQNIDTKFELVPGNHFRDAELRSAKGIMAIVR